MERFVPAKQDRLNSAIVGTEFANTKPENEAASIETYPSVDHGVPPGNLVLARAEAGQMLQAVGDNLAAEPMALDVEQAGGIRLIAASEFEGALD